VVPIRISLIEGCFCSTSDTRRVNLVTNPVISHELGKEREGLTTSGTYLWSFVTQIFHNSQPSCGGDCKTLATYISQLIRYSRACGSYQDFLDRGLLLTRKLLNQGFLLVKLKSSLRKFYSRHHNLVDLFRIKSKICRNNSG
jgi:hypothetical protein